jgi:hypothetical protein
MTKKSLSRADRTFIRKCEEARRLEEQAEADRETIRARRIARRIRSDLEMDDSE